MQDAHEQLVHDDAKMWHKQFQILLIFDMCFDENTHIRKPLRHKNMPFSIRTVQLALIQDYGNKKWNNPNYIHGNFVCDWITRLQCCFLKRIYWPVTLQELPLFRGKRNTYFNVVDVITELR